MLLAGVVLCFLFAQLQVRIKEELEESSDTGPGSLQCLYVVKNHRVNSFGLDLDQHLAALSNLFVDEVLFFFVRADGLSNRIDLVLRVCNFLLCLIKVVVVGALWQHLQPTLSLEQFVALYTQLGTALLFILDVLLNFCILVLFLYLFHLQKMVVYHLLCVVQDPFSNLRRVHLLHLLSDLGRILLLLLV